MSSLGFSDRLQSAPFFYYFNLLSNFAQFSIVMKEYAYKNGIYPYQANSTGTSQDIQPWNLKHINQSPFFPCCQGAFDNHSTQIPLPPELIEKGVWFFPSFFHQLS
jgi:hypothetical protein